MEHENHELLFIDPEVWSVSAIIQLSLLDNYQERNSATDTFKHVFKIRIIPNFPPYPRQNTVDNKLGDSQVLI